MIQKDQNFEIWVTLEVTQKILGLPKKFKTVPLGPVTEPKGFKLDMLGPEGLIDQKVNGVDQIVNGDHFLD